MASIARPPMASHPSSQSSPPPSPVDMNSPPSLAIHYHPPQASPSQPLEINRAISGHNKAIRPRLQGRQETPPSPPNSVVLGEQSPVSPATMQSTSSPVAITQPVEHQDNHDQTPPPSLKQRITRVFKVGHRRGESDLSRTTMSTNDDNTAHQDTTGYLPSPLGEGESGHSKTPNFYARQPSATAMRSIAPNNYFNNNSNAPRRRVMNGGEVRVEILRHPGLVAEDSKNYGGASGTQVGKENQDSSEPYYQYYTQPSESTVAQFEEDGGDEEMRHQVPELRMRRGEDGNPSPLKNDSVPEHSYPAISPGSSDSQERIYIEESISFGFEGYHIGNEVNHSDGSYAGLSSPSSPAYTGGIYSNSGKASSSVLNYMNQSELNILSRNPSSGKSSGALGRPGISRNPSSTSYFSPGMRRVSSGPAASSGSIQLDEAVSRELKRLSKISAGSGTSGFAMVITADGAASTRLEEEFSDHGSERISERRFTKEEKGKGKAVASMARENVVEINEGGSHEKGHQHTKSDASRLLSGDGHSENSSENGDSDGTRELLKGMDGGNPRRKLKSQEVPKDVLVHEGDSTYDFVYRMRQTSDATPILVPQYFYPGGGAFPNRNALTTPTRAKHSPVSPINSSAMSFGGQYGSSPITKPQEAHHRSPDSDRSYYARMHGGDQALDSPNESLRYPDYITDESGSHRGSMTHSLSENKIDTLVHPAFRNGGNGSPSKRSRAVLSMGSLEGIAGFGLGRLITGTPNGTGRRLAGSSLADTSDLSVSRRLEDSPTKSLKKSRMGRVDETTSIPLVQLSPAAYCVPEERKVSFSRLGSRLPMRPKILRRSMTPRLYDPRPLGDSWKDLPNADPEAVEDGTYSREYRMKEKRASMTVLALCLLFPPLLLLVAMGTFDATVDGWTNGEVKGVGRVEKRVAAAVGGVFAVAAVVGGVIAAVLVA